MPKITDLDFEKECKECGCKGGVHKAICSNIWEFDKNATTLPAPKDTPPIDYSKGALWD